MKPRPTLLFALTVTCLMTMGQRSTIELTSTALNNDTHLQMNLSRFFKRTRLRNKI